ncbi:MAG: alpha-galactosidase [Victivallales bacterium]|nr:alpha-galactosidase [Victivallales bacterium]
MFSVATAKFFVNQKWLDLPANGEGLLPDYPLFAHRELWRDGAWHCLTWEFTNQGDTPIQLGSCHLAELHALPGSGKKDTVYLDSNGGWFAGVIRSTSRLPNMEWEYWKNVFCAEEDIEWAKNIQDGDISRASHYSLGGMSVYLRPGHPVLFMGFVVPRLRCLAVPYILNDPTTGEVRRLALVNNFAGYLLQPGESITTETALWRDDDNPHRLLEEYADFCVKTRGLKLRHDTPPVGWLSWYGYRLEITEEECIRVADFVNREYPGFGFKYFQIDLGYNTQNLPGQWFGTNEHFVKGLEHYCQEMRSRGFTPGIWCAAFCVAESSDFYRKHPDAVTRWSGDTPGRWFWEPKDPLYYLDPTHPAAQEFVSKVIRHFRQAGMEYFKIDFMNRLGRVDCEYHPNHSQIVKGAKAYRLACQTLVDNLAPADYLYTCSNLLFDSVGYASTSMTACDIANTGIRQALAEGDDSKLNFYRMQFATTMARYYIHKKFLLLNPDGICIAPPADHEEAWFRTLFVGMSGGQVFLGDRFDLAEPESRDYVKRILPPYGEAAKPVDLFRTPYPDGRPEILYLHTPQREVIGLFNFGGKKAIELDWQELGLKGSYEAWEFYEQKYLGVLDTAQSFACPLPFPAARVLLLTPVSDFPQVIATSFHFTGGAVELLGLHYDKTIQVLSGKLLRPCGDPGSIYIKAPQGYVSSLKEIASGVFELPLVGTGTPLDWKVDFERSL